MLHGFGFEGGHPETKGLSPEGEVITVPEHRHDVSLDITRFELSADYAFLDGYQVRFRLPYEIKDQDSEVELVEPATAAEQEAMLRNMEIHHRDETYDGVSDATLLAARRFTELLVAGDTLVLSLGTSLPIGETEEDPLKAGERGEKHLHIQFGTGTFDPVVEGSYSVPFYPPFSVSFFTRARFPFYENSKTYQGPLEVTAIPTLHWRVTEDLILRANYTFFYQGFAHWDGTQDPNTGLIAHMALAGVSYRLIGDLVLGLDVRLPIDQEPLGRGDAFEFGPTVLASIAYGF